MQIGSQRLPNLESPTRRSLMKAMAGLGAALAYSSFSPAIAAETQSHQPGVPANREDDRIATVLNRLQIYEQETAPILSHYAGKTRLLEVDAEQPKENIAQEIVAAIQSMRRISIAGAQNVQSMVDNNP